MPWFRDQTDDPWAALAGFRIAAPLDISVVVQIAGTTHVVAVDPTAEPIGTLATMADGERLLFLDGQAWPFGLPRADRSEGGAASDGMILSPMPGRVIAVDVELGDKVEKGQRLVVIEAMKMEQGLVAPFDGVITELKALTDTQVSEGMLLARVEKGKT